MATDHQKTINTLVDGVRLLLRAVHVDGAKMNRLYGVTGQQCFVLMKIRDAGPASSANLSRQLHVSPSNMTGLIDRLEKKRLVKRMQRGSDRRVSMIMLTDKGKALSQTLPAPLETKLVSKLAELDPDHLRWLLLAMEDLLSVIEPSEFKRPNPDALVEQSGDVETTMS